MGGSGGGRYTGPSSATLQQRLDKIREQERARLEKNIGDYLRKLLVRFNDRDRVKIASRLEAIQKLLQAFSNVCATKKLYRIAVFIRSLSEIHLPEIRCELCLDEVPGSYIGMWSYHISPWFESGFRCALKFDCDNFSSLFGEFLP